MSDIVKKGWKKYLEELQLNPLRTKAITAGVLVGSSDLVAQKISGLKKIQFRRFLLMMLYGLAYTGPFGHFLHKLIDIIFRGQKGNITVAKKNLRTSYPLFYRLPLLSTCLKDAQKSKARSTKKVLLEQLTSSPWNNCLFMMYYGLVIEGRPWGLVKNKVRKDYPSVQLTAWKFWPIVGWINYQYMPLQFRVLFHSLVASCWAIFLNLKARSTAGKKA